jgi:ATP-dependent DNA helicase RecG
MGFLTEAAGDKIQCTVAGIALFGVKPKRYLKQAGLRVMAFDALDLQYRALLDVVLDGPMLARWVFDDDGVRTIVDDGLVEKLAHTIHPYITIEGDAIDKGFRRPSKALYPMEAIRELILNALAHRDWTRSTDIELRIFSNRLEIISPGALPGSMTIQKMKAGQRYARNPLIMEVLREYNYVEERGMGIRTKVIPQVKAITGKEPDFAADEDCLIITMYRDETTIAPINAPEDETINETINETIKLTAIQQDILREITSNPSVTYEELGEKLGVYRATVARHLNLLKKEGVISRMGSRKTGYWQVNNEKHVDK